ncbi:MAG: sigma-70 family RNA polymerase sigma factor [Bacteroidaceae bacterium]|nr:sigma-70 family RNA polymerase sigma factor [Bacteroidaceae bacterium]
MQQIESDIIRRCREGDRGAFRYVVQNCQGMVYSLSLKMLADVEEAKDAVQDTFIKVWQNIDSYDDRYSFSTWVYTIASRICLDRLRKVKPIGPADADERVFEQVADDTDPERRLESSEWVSVIKVLANGLGGKQKLVFTLSQLEGLETAQITEITGLDAEQIKSNLYAAKKNIRERLIKMGYGKD